MVDPSGMSALPPARTLSVWARGGALVLISLALAGLASSETIHDLFVQLVNVAQRVIVAHPRWGVSLFILLSAVSAMVAFFSTAIITPVAVLTWGKGLSIVLLWVGWLLGGICAYWVGRTLGRPVVQALTSSAALARFEHRLSARTPFGLVLLFQIALPSEVPGYVLGLARYPFAKYLLALSIAELPFAVGTVYLGASFLQRQTTLLIAIGCTGAVLSAAALYRLKRRLLQEAASRRTAPVGHDN
jgi:uncharacterized membrane protein YdjX (TVP38/TMEM64 family)